MYKSPVKKSVKIKFAEGCETGKRHASAAVHMIIAIDLRRSLSTERGTSHAEYCSG
jgi:hypothetical protein